MILKMWVKSKFVLCQPRYYNLLTEKKYENNTVTVDLEKFSFIVKYYYFDERPNKVK